MAADEAQDRRDTRQDGLWGWVEGVSMPMHDCMYDVLYERNGHEPPCKLPKDDPFYSPPSVTK